MKGADLVREYGAGRQRSLWLFALVGGFLGAATVAVANAVLAMDQSEGSLLEGALFLGSLGAMFYCNRRSSRIAVEIFEDLQEGVRDDLAQGLRAAPLRTVERLGALRGKVIGDLMFLSDSTTQLVISIQHAAFLACMTLIIVSLSLKALGIWLLTCAVMALLLFPGLKRVGKVQRAVSERSSELNAQLEELLSGFKQVKLDAEASKTLVADIQASTSSLYQEQARVALTTSGTFLGPNAMYFILGFGLAVFAPADSIGLGPELGYEMSILLALSLGPLSGLLQALPNLSKAKESADAIAEVLTLLSENHREDSQQVDASFDSIDFESLRFTYELRGEGEENRFEVGPIDLKLERGELIFVTGGNGSGKTTLMKMMLGLYPSEGVIRRDGKAVHKKDLSQYRGLFTAIFNGQHLFDRLYGLEASDEDVLDLLEELGIEDVVNYDDDCFLNLDLSSGQKMRLAMVVALLEDRPICVFDEWTANQDPETTRFYHDVLLPQLLAKGKTIVAVSHDDRFFDRADHLIRLDKGEVVLDEYRSQTS